MKALNTPTRQNHDIQRQVLWNKRQYCWRQYTDNVCCWLWWVSSDTDLTLSLTLIVSANISLGNSSRWLWCAFLKGPNWEHQRLKIDNSTAWNYIPNLNATLISSFIPNYPLSKLDITKVCVVIDKSKFRRIYNLVSCRLKALFCICSSISDHNEESWWQLLKDNGPVKGYWKKNIIRSVSLLIQHYFFHQLINCFHSNCRALGCGAS